MTYKEVEKNKTFSSNIRQKLLKISPTYWQERKQAPVTGRLNWGKRLVIHIKSREALWNKKKVTSTCTAKKIASRHHLEKHYATALHVPSFSYPLFIYLFHNNCMKLLGKKKEQSAPSFLYISTKKTKKEWFHASWSINCYLWEKSYILNSTYKQSFPIQISYKVAGLIHLALLYL